MSRMSDGHLGLSEFLAGLAAELSRASLRTDRDNINYGVDQVTLELDIAYTLTPADTASNVKPEFWVLGREMEDVEDRLPSTQWNTQHLILRLTPRLEDAQAGEFEYSGSLTRLPDVRPAKVD